jgi:uncharacterized protein YciU (UPF0263 family)
MSYLKAVLMFCVCVLSGYNLKAQTKVVINESVLGKQIDESFVGFSFNPAFSSQYFSTNYNGSNTRAITVQLFENFKNLQKPSIRIIGANNSYWRNTSNFPNAPLNWNNNPPDIPLTYFPALTKPSFSTVVDQTDLDNFQGFFKALSFQIPAILGFNTSVIDKNRTIDMARVAKLTLTSPSSLEFEIGNEPDLFINNDRRLSGYGLKQYLEEYNYLADAIKIYGKAAAPALAKTGSGSWIDEIESFIDQGENLSTLTYHDYPLGNNGTNSNTANYLNKFLYNRYTKEVADGIAKSVIATKQKNKTLRMGEINTIASGGNFGSSNSFGAALWVIDLMYELANAGASGVNIASEGGSKTCYSPFEFRSDLLKSGNKVWVRPIYYGMLMFARAIPNNSKLLPVNFTTAVNPDQIKIWASKDKDQNTRIMLINRGTSLNDQSNTPIEISLGKRIQIAKYTLLEAQNGIADTSNVTLGGQKVDLNSGIINAANQINIEPENNGNTSTYKINLKASTAVLLEILANKYPTDITLSNNSIAENVPANTLIGSLSSTDQDLNDTFTYTLVAGQGDANNSDFNIAENQLKIKNSPNFEGKNNFSIRLRATDFAGAFTEKVFNILITDLNEAPTDIKLSNNSIAENVLANTLIGSFSSTDQDLNDTFTYTLVAGQGDDNNSDFSIAENQVKIKNSPNFEGKNTFSIRLRATDFAGAFTEKVFSIQITDLNEAPTDIKLSNNSIAENVPANTLIGSLSSTDQDLKDTFTYTLVAGQGDANNNDFSITENQLKIKNSPNFEGKNTFSIRLRATDFAGAFTEKVFNIQITDLNEAPTDIKLSNNSIAENVPANTLIGSLSSTDQDLNDTFTYTLVAGQGDANNSDFSIAENQLKIKNSPNFEGKNTFSIRLKATDFAGAFIEKVFSIQITDLNEAPTDIILSNSSMAENVPANTLIGSFSGLDQDDSDSFSYQLVAGAGDKDNSSFNLSENTLKINISPDFESQSEYNIRVRIRDKSGLSIEKMFVIYIIDVQETPPPFSLPANNFTIAITGETCRKNNDGKIKISAIQNLNYQLSLSHKGQIDVYSFNSIKEISNLQAGNYEACITIEGKVGYKQCFNLMITEPQDLSVYSSININTNILSLSLSGANNYTITLNNQISRINSNKAEFALKEGRNELLVTSDKTCQGSIYRTIYYNSQVLVYPNPFFNSLKIELNEEKQVSKIVVMDLNGKVFYQKHSTNGFFENSLELDLSFLPAGLYMLKLSGNNLETAQKILKQ